jgi:predicted nucleotidyltransferase
MQAIETEAVQVEKIVRAFANELVKQLGSQIYEIIWYGSTARGEATEDSDIDVAIIAEREDFVFRKQVGSISSWFSLEFDTLVDARIIAYAKYHGEWGRLSLLVDEIVKDGKSLWTRSTN